MHNDPNHFKSILCLLACPEFIGAHRPKDKFRVSNLTAVIGYEK